MEYPLSPYSSNAQYSSVNNKLPIKLGINIGVSLEYYDFVIYALLLPYIMPLFFDANDPFVNMVKAFSVFALGYLARPIGGFIFGQIADKKGRKMAFTGAMLIMGIATCIIGFLPTISMLPPSLSVLPAFLLIVCRFAQGLSFGAELPSVITIVSENKDDSKRGFTCGLVISCTSIGAIFATGVLTTLTYFIPPEHFLLWGWRIPFLLGGFLALISWYLRKNMNETSAFQEKKKELNLEKSPFMTLIKKYPSIIIAGIGIVLVPASLGITNIFFASYMASFFAFDPIHIYFCMTAGLVFSIFLTPFFGWLSDLIGVKTLFMIMCVLLSIACPYLFLLPKMHTGKALLIFLLLWQCFLCAGMSSVLPWLTKLFPTEVRCSGISFCYNIAYALGAMLPSIYMLIIKPELHAETISKIICGIAILGLMNALFLQKISKKRCLNY